MNGRRQLAESRQKIIAALVAKFAQECLSKANLQVQA